MDQKVFFVSTVGPFTEAGVLEHSSFGRYVIKFEGHCIEEPKWRCPMKQLFHRSGAQKGRQPWAQGATEATRAEQNTQEGEHCKEEQPEPNPGGAARRRVILIWDQEDTSKEVQGKTPGQCGFAKPREKNVPEGGCAKSCRETFLGSERRKWVCDPPCQTITQSECESHSVFEESLAWQYFDLIFALNV